jgi:uncharacterized protein YndB with AHSA1/START domain
MLNSYRFREFWTVAAPPEAAWQLVADPTTYPRWWSEFVEVERRNDLDGVGARVAVHVKATLPYHMRFELEATQRDEPRVAEVRVRGDLNGMMRWTLTPAAEGTWLRFEEEVRTGKRLLDLMAPVAKPLFAWNHGIMMRHGEAGLRRELEAR